MQDFIRGRTLYINELFVNDTQRFCIKILNKYIKLIINYLILYSFERQI